MDTHEITARISQKLKAQEIVADSERIEAKINRLVMEFGVPPAEAERTILLDILKEHGKQMPKPAASSSADMVAIADIAPGEWVTIEGKVVSVTDPPSPAVAQKGVIADDSGAISFVIFAKGAPALLRQGEWYRLESAVVDEFRGLANLKIHSGTVVTPINEDRPLAPVVTRIADLTPGIASIRAKVTQNWDVRHDRMQQTGLLGDESGTVKFTVWKGGSDQKLATEQAYLIGFASVEEYNGRLSVIIDPASCSFLEDDDIEARTGSAGSMEEALPRMEVKVVSLEASASDAIAAQGIIATADGEYPFTLWANADILPPEQGLCYAIEGAKMGSFRGASRISIGEGALITPIEDRFFPPPPLTTVADLSPGIASVRVKLVQEWESRSDRMLQTGLIGDETGVVKFILWNTGGACKLEENTVYNFFYVIVDEYNGRLSVNLTHATPLPEEEGDIEVARDGTTITGALVHIASGSGIVKRCPEEGCNRVLSRQNFCPIHEFKPDFKYDLRIRGSLDDGHIARNILIPREVVESLFQMTLAEAQEIAENQPLGADEVIRQLTERALGRYLKVTARQFEDLFIANHADWLTPDMSRHTALLNRAGGDF